MQTPVVAMSVQRVDEPQMLGADVCLIHVGLVLFVQVAEFYRHFIKQET